MSKTAVEPKALTDTEKKIRMNEIKDLLAKLSEAIVGKGTVITLREGTKWHYQTE